MQCYENFEVKPEITATRGAFMLTLPNMNHARAVRQHKPQHQIVLEYLRDNGIVTNETVQELLSVRQTRAYTVIREMVGEGMIVKHGTGKDDNEYVLVK